MRCVGRRWGGRLKGILGVGMKSLKEAVSRKKDGHRAMCLNNTEENKRMYKSMKLKQFHKQ